MITFSEAIKLKDGVLYNLKYHQERVDRTIGEFYQSSIDLSVIGENIPAHVKEGLFKCRVLYANKILKVEFIPYFFRIINKVGVLVNDKIDYSYKFADRSEINNMLRKSGCDDILIIKNGLVTDASSLNLVFKRPKELFTPQDYLLPGTKRKYLLDKGMIKEKHIYLEDIQSFSSIYFINAMIDLEDEIKVDTSNLIYI